MPLPTHQQMLDAQAQFGPFDDIVLEQSARIAELEAIINRINEHADVMRNQVGTGALVSNIRQGFQTIIEITREATREE